MNLETVVPGVAIVSGAVDGVELGEGAQEALGGDGGAGEGGNGSGREKSDEGIWDVG